MVYGFNGDVYDCVNVRAKEAKKIFEVITLSLKVVPARMV